MRSFYLTYKAMKVRYIELKVILAASGVNLTEPDRMKESFTSGYGGNF